MFLFGNIRDFSHRSYQMTEWLDAKRLETLRPASQAETAGYSGLRLIRF